jgi:catechol 2,3-dioxygenase-like lactoylglutathione lyase family enzyme
MRLDHIAYRVADRKRTADFFVKAFGYKVQSEFEIFFDEAKTQKAQCMALQPPENFKPDLQFMYRYYYINPDTAEMEMNYYHLAPEIFVSDGSPGSVVGDWVKSRDGIGGIHHLAYQVESVEKIAEEWYRNGWANFTTAKPLKCPDLTQIFTVPHPLTGVIYEFIERGKHGFCKDNVKALMESTKGIK